MATARGVHLQRDKKVVDYFSRMYSFHRISFSGGSPFLTLITFVGAGVYQVYVASKYLNNPSQNVSYLDGCKCTPNAPWPVNSTCALNGTSAAIPFEECIQCNNDAGSVPNVGNANFIGGSAVGAVFIQIVMICIAVFAFQVKQWLAGEFLARGIRVRHLRGGRCAIPAVRVPFFIQLLMLVLSIAYVLYATFVFLKGQGDIKLRCGWLTSTFDANNTTYQRNELSAIALVMITTAFVYKDTLITAWGLSVHPLEDVNAKELVKDPELASKLCTHFAEVDMTVVMGVRIELTNSAAEAAKQQGKNVKPAPVTWKQVIAVLLERNLVVSTGAACDNSDDVATVENPLSRHQHSEHQPETTTP